MNLGLTKNIYHYLAIFVIGVILRFYYSTYESYWFDEQIAFLYRIQKYPSKKHWLEAITATIVLFYLIFFKILVLLSSVIRLI